MRQKAQVPLLILAIAVLLLVYVFFLPLSEKCKIMNLPECTKLTGKIFSASPGIIELKDNKVEYKIPDVDLYTIGGTESKDLAEMIEVRRGWFTSYSPKLFFETHEKSKDVKIYIYLTEDKTAKLFVNGKKVAKVKGIGQHIIPILSSQLQTSNTLEVYPSVPFFFWNVNKLKIGKIFYEETYTITQEKVNYQLDINEDIRDIENAMLKFRANCFFKDNNLSIILNKTEIFNGVVCTSFEKDITKYLHKSNNFSFFSKGNYFLYDITVLVKLKQNVWPTYYFDIIEMRKYNLLKLRFADTGEKKLTVYLNEKSISIETSDMEWQLDVTEYLHEGKNKIIIIPSKTVNVSEIGIY